MHRLSGSTRETVVLTFRSKAIFFYAIAMGTVALDQITKAIARGTLAEGEVVTVIPGFFGLALSYNSGAAFGMLPDWAPLFIVVALVAIYAIIRLRSASPDSTSLTVGLALLLGGALGNLIDRLFMPGRAVTDFLYFYVDIGGKLREWPTFNIADAAVVIGAALMFYYVYVIEKRRA